MYDIGDNHPFLFIYLKKLFVRLNEFKCIS